MGNKAISIALEVRLNTIQPSLPIAWENVNYKPASPSQPYEQANVLFAAPENPTFGDDFYRQRGYLQVTLYYPQNIGKSAILDRAELIRQAFKRGQTMTAFDVDTIVEETPEITGGEVRDAYFSVIVRVRFFANIGAGVIVVPVPPVDGNDENMITKTTGQAIGALKGVRIDAAGLVWQSDKDDASVDATIGISITAAGSGQSIDIKLAGEVTDNSWNWTPGSVWLGDNGQPTQVLPLTGSIFRLGVATGPNSMIVEPQLVAILGS